MSEGLAKFNKHIDVKAVKTLPFVFSRLFYTSYIKPIYSRHIYILVTEQNFCLKSKFIQILLINTMLNIRPRDDI